MQAPNWDPTEGSGQVLLLDILSHRMSEIRMFTPAIRMTAGCRREASVCACIYSREWPFGVRKCRATRPFRIAKQARMPEH